MFYSRQSEIKQLQGLFKGEALCLYGLRRVGKTSLIQEVFNGHRCLYYECTKDSLDNNLKQFTEEARRSGIAIPSYVDFKSFSDAFLFLADTKMVEAIAIDEYPYLKTFESAEKVDSLFQGIIERVHGKMGIILSGSEISSMKNLLLPGNPLFGRFNQTIRLPEFNYLEASHFYPGKSVYDKVALYSVFGGSPYVNRSIDPSKDLKDNIVATFLRQGSEAYNYADSVLLMGLTNATHAERILGVLGNSKKRHGEIVALLDQNKTGVLSRSLASLVQSNVIKVAFPINRPYDKKKSFYEIADPALRFFYAYVHPNKSRLATLGPEEFYNQYVKPSITTFVSHRFEEITRDYFSILTQRGLLPGTKDIGVYYYGDSENHKNGKFDVAISKVDGYEVYEVKYLQNVMSEALVKEEADKIRAIKELNVARIGFVSVNGFESDEGKYKFITGEDLYALSL